MSCSYFTSEELNNFVQSIPSDKFEFNCSNGEVIKKFDKYQIFINLFPKKGEINETPILDQDDWDIINIFYMLYSYQPF